MKKLYFFLFLLFLFFCSQYSWGQIKLGNNPANIDPTALLELESSTHGLLLPRMTSAQRDALPMDTSPIGLLIFNTDLNEIQYLYEATVVNAKGEQRQELRWESATDDTIPFTQPTNPAAGQLFYDSATKQLNLWNGNEWVVVGESTTNSGGATSTLSYQNLTLTGTQLSISNGNTTLNGALTINTTSTTASYTLPVGGGTAGQVLSIDNATSGTTTWTNVIIEITGLVSVTENGNTGYRLANVDMANHGDIEDNAIDLSIQDQASIVRGASGDFAFAVGNRTVASGDYSSVFGFDSTASGKYSSAFGQETRAEAYAQTTLGHNSTLHPGTPNATGITATDRLLVVGNGTTASTRSDALVILKNGHVGIGDSTPTEGTLVVSGTIVSSGNMTANATLTPDYVFESYFKGSSEANPAYRFPSLAEVEAFVKENHHLPNVPSANEVREQGGIVLNRASEVQLEKIEELYLHTIEQQKQLGAQQEQLAAQQKEIETLKAMIKVLLEKK